MLEGFEQAGQDADRYDICADYDAMYSMSDKLKAIGIDLSESTKKMLLALQASQGFLSGRQYERARATTLNCIEAAGVTVNNIQNATVFLSELMNTIEDYSRCRYEED